MGKYLFWEIIFSDKKFYQETANNNNEASIRSLVTQIGLVSKHVTVQYKGNYDGNKNYKPGKKNKFVNVKNVKHYRKKSYENVEV